MVDEGYAGDLDVVDVWERLQGPAGGLVVDVRTRAEWGFVGLPDLGALGTDPVLVEWQVYPSMAVNERFVAELFAAMQQRGLGPEVPVYFLCRSGVRSRHAAIAATAAGLREAYNIADGFEGPVGPEGQRGKVAGWKARGLPWRQG